MNRRYGADVAGRIDDLIRRDGFCTPAAVVEDGRAPSSPFHRHLEWDDTAAAHEHRLSQARGIIRCFRVVDQPGEATVPVYVHVAEVNATDAAGYVRRETAMADPELRERYLRGELARIAGAVARVEGEPEFGPMVSAVDAVRRALETPFAMAAD